MYFIHAGLIVRLVMSMLILASICSWAIILQRASLIQKARTVLKDFEDKFWSGADLNKLYDAMDHQSQELSDIELIFHAGFKEFLRLKKQTAIQPVAIMEGVQRAMRIAHARELDKLEQHLPFLATVGSTSPYVGLFGTVWGIMTAFHALGDVQQASIAMVAPGISEALVATAMGLFAAIPAVVAYNRFTNQVDRLLNHYETFQEEFSNILHRQLVQTGHAV
jgi:biopolymer transport protein TolQ